MRSAPPVPGVKWLPAEDGSERSRMGERHGGWRIHVLRIWCHAWQPPAFGRAMPRLVSEQEHIDRDLIPKVSACSAIESHAPRFSTCP
jgi:hypothetical protein